jgi:hypothetical protein
MKLLFLISIVMIVGVGYLWHSEVGENETYLLPNRFMGIVTIIFNQKNGMPEKYEGDKRLYEIPDNGILITQFKQNYGWHKFPTYYYIAADNKRIQIPYALEAYQLSLDTIKIYGHRSGMNGDEATSYVKYDMFFVSTKKEIDSLENIADKLYPLDIIKH